MGFAGYVAAACSFIVDVSCHCFRLHVSAYMAIFRRVGYFYFYIPEGICFAGFCLFCTWSHFARIRLCFPVLFFFVNFVVCCVCVCLLAFSLLLLLFYNRAARRRKHNLQTSLKTRDYCSSRKNTARRNFCSVSV
jgi:hypothetical protein